MMESINFIIDDIQHDDVIEEERESITTKQHVTLDVPYKCTNIDIPPENENLEGVDDNALVNIETSTKIQKGQPIENVIADLNEGVITMSSTSRQMYFV